MVLFGQSGGLYDHYFSTFLNPIDLLWSFLQAILMALAILLIHTYYGYFATGGPSGVGVAVGNAVRTSLDRRRVGHAAGLAGRLRLQRQLQPVGLGEDIDVKLSRPPAGGAGDGRRARSRSSFFAVGLFRGGFGTTVPVTVVSDRAGLVMNPEAKVKMRGVQVGKVDSIETRPDGKAALHLAMDPSQLQHIPANVARQHHVVDRVRRQVRRIGRAARPVVAAAAARARCSTPSTSPSRSTPSSSNSSRC